MGARNHDNDPQPGLIVPLRYPYEKWLERPHPPSEVMPHEVVHDAWLCPLGSHPYLAQGPFNCG